MTKAELLAQVQAQFQVLYLSPEQITALLAQALRVCQSKVGPFSDISCDGTVDTPADFLSVAVAVDANGRWQEVKRIRTPAVPATEETAEVPATDVLQIVGRAPVTYPQASPIEVALTAGYTNSFYGYGRVENTKALPPFSIVYFLDLAKNDEIPPLIEGLLYSYLSILIEIPNNQRARQVATTTGMQVELPSDEELKQRKDLIETDMEESAAIIPSAAVF